MTRFIHPLSMFCSYHLSKRVTTAAGFSLAAVYEIYCSWSPDRLSSDKTTDLMNDYIKFQVVNYDPSKIFSSKCSSAQPKDTLRC